MYIPKTRQARVVGRALAGQSRRTIAREEGLHRDTVARILSQPEFQNIIESFRSQMVDLLPEVIRTYRHHLRHKDLAAARDMAHGLQVFRPKAEQVVTQRADFPLDRPTKDYEFFAEYARWPEESEEKE